MENLLLRVRDAAILRPPFAVRGFWRRSICRRLPPVATAGLHQGSIPRRTRDCAKPDFGSTAPAMELEAFVLRRPRKPPNAFAAVVDFRGFAVRRRGG